MKSRFVICIIFFSVIIFAEGNKKNSVLLNKSETVLNFLQTGKNLVSDNDNQLYAAILTCTDFNRNLTKIFNLQSKNYLHSKCNGNTCAKTTKKKIENALLISQVPVLVIMGHTNCGIISDVTNCEQGHSHNIAHPVNPNVRSAVKRAKIRFPDSSDETIISCAIEETVWQTIKEFFVQSQLLRLLHKTGKVKVVGAIYDEKKGKVKWLQEQKVEKIFKVVESIPAIRNKQYVSGLK